MSLLALAKTVRSDQRGVAAVEMAMVAPIIAGLALVSVNVWDATQRRQQQDEALRVASQYYMLGGDNDARARELGLAAWADKPADGDVVISRIYRCGDSQVNAAALCGTAQTPPNTMVKIVARASTVRSEMVRVR